MFINPYQAGGQKDMNLISKWEATGLLSNLPSHVSKRNLAQLLENQAIQTERRKASGSNYIGIDEEQELESMVPVIIRKIFTDPRLSFTWDVMAQPADCIDYCGRSMNIRANTELLATKIDYDDVDWFKHSRMNGLVELIDLTVTKLINELNMKMQDKAVFMYVPIDFFSALLSPGHYRAHPIFGLAVRYGHVPKIHGWRPRGYTGK